MEAYGKAALFERAQKVASTVEPVPDAPVPVALTVHLLSVNACHEFE